MGIYLNPGNELFTRIKNNDIYVDKSGIIPELVDIFEHRNEYICVCRPRRFGKTIIANMLNAYFSKGCDSRELFDGSIASKSSIFEKYLNKINVIKIDLNAEYQTVEDTENLFPILCRRINKELAETFADCALDEEESLAYNLISVYTKTGETFAFIIDEYDIMVREAASGNISERSFEKYLSFLNGLFKNTTLEPAITFAYLTGILPIVREKNQSKLNNFEENTMIDPDRLSQFIGFTSDEVEALCRNHGATFEECRRWYDGYKLKSVDLYNPKPVVQSIIKGEYKSYWGQTSTYEVIADYINLELEGIKEEVINLVAGGRSYVDIGSYKNTMKDFKTRHDIFTCLIHLGYLAFDPAEQTCYIPNREVREEWVRAMRIKDIYSVTSKIIEDSTKLLEDTISWNEDAVAQSLDLSHEQVAGNRSYDSEDVLHCAISLSYFYALNKYNIINEMPSGNGIVDMVYLPFVEGLPALIFEVKNKAVTESALKQIEARQYYDSLSSYKGNLLFVAINYDEKTKRHTCKIERFVKE